MACACSCCCGACCTISGNSVSCSLDDKDGCQGTGKSWLGGGTTCTTGICPQTSACCVNPSSGSTDLSTCVTVFSWQECASLGGLWLGSGSSCAGNNPCVYACCSGGTCYERGVGQFGNCSGSDEFMGYGTACSTANICATGACCESATVCTQRTPTACAALGGSFRGVGTGCASAQCDCPSTPKLPITVYRTGGLPVPGNCTPVAVGTITTTSGSVTVTGGFSSTYSSIETQAVDACGRCVYSANNAVSGGGTASITVTYAVCAVGYPFQNTTPWCNNPMCNPLP
jgi:hypothetical protein